MRNSDYFANDKRRCKKCNGDLVETYTVRECAGCGNDEAECDCEVTS